MLSINNGCKSILNVLAKQQQVKQIQIAGYAVAKKKVVKGGKAKTEDDDEDNRDLNTKYDIKVSKGSYQKIIQRFTSTWKRPDSINQNRSEEEQRIRKFMFEFAQYSKEIAQNRDDEETEKLNYQFDAIMELPEDLRKIALLVDTHDEQPALVPLLFDTPPTKGNPQKNIQLKKKDKSLKPSQRLILNTSTQS